MHYRMRQKFLAVADRYVIEDESGRAAFIADGRFLTLADRITLKDGEGNELAQIEEKLLAWGRTHRLLRDDSPIATIRKDTASCLRNEFEIELSGGELILCVSDVWGRKYVFTYNGEMLGMMTRPWFSFSAEWKIKIADGAPVAMLIAAAIVVDKTAHSFMH